MWLQLDVVQISDLLRIRSWLKRRSWRNDVCSPGSQSTAEQGKHSNAHLEMNHRVQANKCYHLAQPFRLIISTELCLWMCMRWERRGGEDERPVHWTNHANRAGLHPVPVKWEIEPSAAFCSTAASAKTQYVGSKGPRWQELSPQRISSASLYCVLLIWLQYPPGQYRGERVRITAWWIGRNCRTLQSLLLLYWRVSSMCTFLTIQSLKLTGCWKTKMKLRPRLFHVQP